MKDIESLHKALQLKLIERKGKVRDRQESTAEHVYGCLILAEHFMPSVEDIDELKVFRMLLYHDMVEIEAGDVFLLDDSKRKGKDEREKDAC